MEDNTLKELWEICIAILLIAFIGVLTFAHSAWMPSMATMLTLVLIVATFSVFAVFVWRERGGDEREQLMRHVASRFAFLLTGAVLVVGIIYETLAHYGPNIWLAGALVAMVGGKVIGHAYARRKY